MIGIIEQHVLALLRAVGYLIVLQQARSQSYPWNSGTCYQAARGGHLAVLQWARSQGCDWDSDTCSYATMEGHLAVLQCARSQAKAVVGAI